MATRKDEAVKTVGILARIAKFLGAVLSKQGVDE